MILLTGSTGFLGSHLARELHSTNSAYITTTRKGYNLTNATAVQTMMAKLQEHQYPSIVIHTAALTNVEWCQRDPVLAHDTNCLAVKNIVQAMPKDCRLIYISTDMIYSGPGPHRENSHTESPINMYGLSKYLGEFEAAQAPNHLILRTNFYGWRNKSLTDYIIK